MSKLVTLLRPAPNYTTRSLLRTAVSDPDDTPECEEPGCFVRDKAIELIDAAGSRRRLKHMLLDRKCSVFERRRHLSWRTSGSPG